MYVPEHFKVSDQREIENFLERYDFATLVSMAGERLIATHLPVIVRPEASGLVVAGHVARANPHWKSLDGKDEALLIFHGPHGYVSPTWYVGGPAVPTWNYGVVHAYGPARAVEEVAFLEETLEALVRRYEAHRVNGWRVDGLPFDYRAKALAAVMGIRMPVTRLEAKFKLGQNREMADRLGTVEGLEREGSTEAANLATFMRSQLNDD